jgi:hypothetical protein
VAPKRSCGAAARGGRRRRRSRCTGSLRVDNSRWPAGGGQPRRPWSSPQGWSRRWRGRRRRPGRRCKRELVPRPRLRPKPCGRQQDAAPVSRMQCLYGRKPGAAEASWAAPGALRTFGVHTALPYGVWGDLLCAFVLQPPTALTRRLHVFCLVSHQLVLDGAAQRFCQQCGRCVHARVGAAVPAEHPSTGHQGPPASQRPR